jgi:hypothetical protein
MHMGLDCADVSGRESAARPRASGSERPESASRGRWTGLSSSINLTLIATLRSGHRSRERRDRQSGVCGHGRRLASRRPRDRLEVLRLDDYRLLGRLRPSNFKRHCVLARGVYSLLGPQPRARVQSALAALMSLARRRDHGALAVRAHHERARRPPSH